MKTALITGSTKGIGLQIGLDLLDKGYFVYFTYNKDVESAQKLQDELRTWYSGKFCILKSNVSSYAEIIQITKQIDILDVLVLNVGITDRTPFGSIMIEDWNKVMNTNLTNPFFLVQELKDKIRPNGKIIFISSISGLTTDSTSIAYGVSKGAIHVLVPYLAKELSKTGITVNAIAPGYIDTNWHKGKSKAQIKRIEDKCLAKRLGTTKEISHAVNFIIENDFVNGQIIRVDGGFNVKI